MHTSSCGQVGHGANPQSYNIDFAHECNCGNTYHSCSTWTDTDTVKSYRTYTVQPPAYTYRMLELKDPVDLFDGYCTNEMSLPNGDYMMTESIVDIRDCLKACPQNAFVYDSGPNEGKCLCVGEICDDNMTATDEGRTYKLMTKDSLRSCLMGIVKGMVDMSEQSIPIRLMIYGNGSRVL